MKKNLIHTSKTKIKMKTSNKLFLGYLIFCLIFLIVMGIELKRGLEETAQEKIAYNESLKTPETALSIDTDDVSVKISAYTTKLELENIKNQLEKEKNISLDFSQSEFCEDEKITKLAFTIITSNIKIYKYQPNINILENNATIVIKGNSSFSIKSVKR